MIFYFTGTGNSSYIAKRIAIELNDKVISIAEAVLQGNNSFKLEADESIGFVYPVHRFGPPQIVLDFIKKLQLQGYKGNYVYSVFNCAGMAEDTANIIKKALYKRNYTMTGDYHVIMPGNYMTADSKITKERSQEFLTDSDKRIDEIVESVKNRTNNYRKEKHSFYLSYIIRTVGKMETSTPFIVNDKCVGCGKCSNICPTKAIEMAEGHPVRKAKKCTFCMGCINCCPQNAIDFGKNTVGKERYIHPKYDGFTRNNWK